MEQSKLNSREFIGYDYKEIECPYETASWLVHGYQSFGWEQDLTFPIQNLSDKTKIILRRNRKIANKVELTRLQQHFEACTNEVDKLEKSVDREPTMIAITIGVIGTFFMAGSTFAATATHPLVILCILLAVPGFSGWIAPIFLRRYLMERKYKQIQPLVEEKKDELEMICEKGLALL